MFEVDRGPCPKMSQQLQNCKKGNSTKYLFPPPPEMQKQDFSQCKLDYKDFFMSKFVNIYVYNLDPCIKHSTVVAKY